MFLRFPEGFLWGSGTSAHQVEGGNRWNDWWAFEHQGHIRDGEVSGDACDQWHLFRQDLELAADLGQKAHKISIEWSRVEKEPGVFDEAALAHYAEVLAAMRDLGLKSFVTLHHFTSPLWLEATGCWESAEAVGRFGAFCSVVAQRLGHLVDAWITVNEPMLLAAFGYIEGYWPPRRKSLFAGLRAARNLAAAHNTAYDAVKAVHPDAAVGVAVNSTVFELSAQHALWERLFVTPADWLGNLWYLDRCRGRLDFVGLQYYSRTTVRQLLFGDPTGGPLGDELPVTDLGWAIYPEGIHKVVKQAWRRYRVPIYITENGLADADDVIRKVFIHDHLKCLHEAIEEGADVRGYLHWSLIDNFEWREGFSPRFGLVAVDYATQERTVRDSARYYAMICHENGLEVADPSVQRVP